ncbi:unnamed protein product, partial [Rangifer tarandus platyrhynchus]
MYWGASLGASLPGSNPHLSPRPRRRPSSPKFVPFPLGLLSGRGRAHVPGPSRRRYRVQRQHPHRCPAELALCNGSGSRDSKRTQLTRVGFSLFPFSVYIWYQVSLIRGSRCFFAGKDRKEWPSGSRRCGRGARGRPGWRGLPSFSETQPQTARVRKGRDTVVRRVRAPGQRPAGADWERGSIYLLPLLSALSQRIFKTAFRITFYDVFSTINVSRTMSIRVAYSITLMLHLQTATPIRAEDLWSVERPPALAQAGWKPAKGVPRRFCTAPPKAGRDLTYRLPRDAGGVALQLGGEQFIPRRPIPAHLR